MTKSRSAQVIGSIAATAFFALANPAAAETLEINGLYPARFAEASQARTIRVEGLRGNAGEALRYELESRLAQVRVGEEPWFDVRLGRQQGDSEATLSGLADAQISENAYLERRSKCIERDENKTCVRKAEWSERCYSRSVILSAKIDLINSDRRRLYSERKIQSKYDSSCSGPHMLISVDDAVASLLTQIADDISRDITPQYRRENIRVSEDRKYMPDGIAQQFKQAVKYTKSDPAAACQLWTSIDNQMPNLGPVIYNLALCAEQRNQFDKADALYSRAQGIMPDLKKAVAGPQRIQARRRAAEIYGQQLATQ
jgi:tetratricopeptide (TPR) repeat protein